MSWGKRKSERVSFAKGLVVHAMGIDGTWQRTCTMLDISSTGARLLVEGSIEVMHLKEFFLLLSSRGLAFRRCELVRVNGDEIGVRFIEEKPEKKKKRVVGADA
jgi:PilZ domain